MRIIITGGRNRNDWGSVYDAISRLTEQVASNANVTIIEGACPTGIDHIAGDYAIDNDMILDTYPADWDTYGKAAGPRRNEQMAQAGADICLAFPSAGKSAGTWDMIRRAANHGIPTIIIPEETK